MWKDGDSSRKNWENLVTSPPNNLMTDKTKQTHSWSSVLDFRGAKVRLSLRCRCSKINHKCIEMLRSFEVPLVSIFGFVWKEGILVFTGFSSFPHELGLWSVYPIRGHAPVASADQSHTTELPHSTLQLCLWTRRILHDLSRKSAIWKRDRHFNGPIQPESWLRIRKLEVQGPSNS